MVHRGASGRCCWQTTRTLAAASHSPATESPSCFRSRWRPRGSIYLSSASPMPGNSFCRPLVRRLLRQLYRSWRLGPLRRRVPALTADIPNLESGEPFPIVASLTCTVGRFEIPGFVSLGETMVVEPDKGAVAVWAPSGLSFHSDAMILNEAFVAALYAEENVTIGQAGPRGTHYLREIRTHALHAAHLQHPRRPGDVCAVT